jgi:nucleoside-diphosphate-sugar epimerase
MVLTLVASEKGIGVFNIGNDEEITMLHLAKEVHEVVGREFSPIHLPERSNDPLRRQPDMSKTWAITGPCQISLREGLTYTAEYYREQ